METFQEEFLFLAKRYKEQAEEDVKKWAAHIEKFDKTDKEPVAKLQCSDGLSAKEKEIERLETLLNSRLLDQEMHKAWHENLPDIQASRDILFNGIVYICWINCKLCLEQNAERLWLDRDYDSLQKI